VKTAGSIWKVGWRLAVGTTLLLWIFHTIFFLEGRRAWMAQGRSWEALPKTEQWATAWTYGPQELWSTVRLVSPAGLVASFLCMGLILLLGVIRWRMVLRVHGLNLSFARAGQISLVAHFFNSFLLGSTGGDLIKAYYAARETHHKKTEAVVTVAVDRLLGLFSILLFAVVMMLPNFMLLTGERRLAALASLVFLMFLGCGSIVILSLWGGLSRRWPQSRVWLKRLPKAELLEHALGACRPFGQDWRLLGRVLAISTALNICCVLGVRISPTVLLVIVPMIVCVSALPVTPSGLGVRENLYVWMLGVPGIGVEATEALSLSLLAYAGFLAWSVVGGIVYMTRRKREHLGEIARPDVVAAE